MINDNHKNYNFVYRSIEKRLISEVEAVMNIKKTENPISSECNNI